MTGADVLFPPQFESLEQDLDDRVAKRGDEFILRDVRVVDLLYQDVETGGHGTRRDYDVGYVRNRQRSDGSRVYGFLYRAVEEAIARNHVAAHQPSETRASDHAFVHEDAVEIGVRGVGRQELPDYDLQSRQWIQVLEVEPPDRKDEPALVHQAFYCRLPEPRFLSEMVVNHRLRQTRRSGDLARRDRLVPVASEKIDCSREKLLSRVLVFPRAPADRFGSWHALNVPESRIDWKGISPGRKGRLQGCSISKRHQRDDGYRKEGNVHRIILACVVCLATLTTNRGVATAGSPVKIGVLTDMSSVYADGAGKGSVEAARMAIEDAGDVLGAPAELVSADHQNKPDIATGIARQWYDRDGVDMITDLPGSPVGFAVQTMSLQYKKPVLLVASTSSDITGPRCTPYSAMWGVDTYTLSNILGTYLTKSGLDTWYFIAIDAAVGRTFVSEGSEFISAAGGKVLGAAYAPINSPDFSSFLLQAQSSKAKVIGLANAGADTVLAIQQGAEFGLMKAGQKFAAFIVLEGVLKSLGLQTAQGLLVAAPFYWNLNDETKAWSAKFAKRMGRPPTWNQALVYSAVNHYLKAVKAAGTRDPDTVMAKMRELPIEDPMTIKGKLRIDGRLVRDNYLFQVKAPGESSSDWDLYKLVTAIPGEEVTRPLSKGNCPLVR